MKKYFTVSDVHSFYSELSDALHRKGFDLTDPEHILVICGDAFDRGSESIKLFEFIKDLHKENRLVYVRGNHEDLLMNFVDAIRKNKNIGMHHISNGTAHTVAQITNTTVYDVVGQTVDRKSFDEKIDELLSFINSVTVDYFELGKTVFVHGWVPTATDAEGKIIVHENWRDGGWSDARWDNGMEMFHFNIFPMDKEIVVCGHWHTSFAWANYEKKCSEWNADAIFDPYIKYSKDCYHMIVAIDACTAHTYTVNCVVFDENGNIIDN